MRKEQQQEFSDNHKAQIISSELRKQNRNRTNFKDIQQEIMQYQQRKWEMKWKKEKFDGHNVAILYSGRTAKQEKIFSSWQKYYA